MNLMVIQLALSNPLNFVFGWLTKVFYDFFGNYGLAIIVLTVVIRGLLIPLNISSQKSMLKTQALQAKFAEVQRKYPDDKNKQQEEMMRIQQENGAMPVSGCLLPFLQLFFLWPIFRVVSAPLRWISGVSVDSLTKMAELAGLTDSQISNIGVNHISLIRALSENGGLVAESVKNGYISMTQLIDLHFLGIDLTDTPAWNPLTIATDPKKYLVLLIFPILVVAVNFVSIKLTTVLKPGYKEAKLAKERAKVNPAAKETKPQDPSEQSMKMMTWMMPALMLITTFTMPAAMGLYWIVGGIMGIISQVLVYYLFTKPLDAKKAEMAKKKEEAFKKKSKSDNEVSDSKKNSKKRK